MGWIPAKAGMMGKERWKTMLKRLVGLMGAAEAGRKAARAEGGIDAHRDLRAMVRKGVIDQSRANDFGAVYTYAINEGMDEEKAYALSVAYADSVAQGRSNAYAIVYAAAYGIACFIIGASEGWARAYAQACAHAIAARESIEFASTYGHAIANGASPEDALVFARRYAV